MLQKAFISIEDERFYEHNGIDVRGLFRVLFKVIREGDFAGASTITSNLLKTRFLMGAGNLSLWTK